MANYNNLKATINANIKANGNEEITGPILNTVLNQAVTTLGDGWSYKGIATPSMSPGTPDSNVFYIATTAGTYTNFGSLVVAEGEVAILKYNGSWAKEVTGAATAAQVTQLGQDVDDNSILQKGAYRAVTITDFSDYARRSRYPNGNTWATGTSASVYKHTLIPIKGAIAVKVTSPNDNTTITAFFTNFDAPVSGGAVPFASGTTAVTIPQGESLFLSVPEDADALYVYFGRSADGYPRTPASVTIYCSECADIEKDITIRKTISPHIYVAGGFRAQATIGANSSYSVWFCEVKNGDIVSAKVTNPGQYLSHGFTQVAPGPDITVEQYVQDSGSNRVYNYCAPFDGFFIIGAIPATGVVFSIRRNSIGLSSAFSLSMKKIPKRGCNLITEDTITEGVYVSGTTGNYIAGTSYCAIEVLFPTDDARIYLNRIYAGYFALFDKDGNIVMSKGADSADRVMYSGFRLPKGVVRGRFTSQNTKETILSTGYISYYHPLTQEECDNRVDYEDSFSFDKPEETPTEYNGRDMSSFRHIVCCGDSLTQGVFNQSSGSGPLDTSGYDYPANLAAISGRDVVNLGYGGATSTSWLSRFGDDERLSGNDCAIIQLGANDDGSTLDTTSRTAFIGIIDRLKELNNGIKIFLAGIINGQSYRCATSDETYYAKDQWIKGLYAELYENDPQVFLIDHAKFGHLRDDKAGTYNTDRDNYNMGHLSAYGYNRLAQDYYSYIGWIMHNNDQGFRAIQFIGTNYT